MSSEQCFEVFWVSCFLEQVLGIDVNHVQRHDHLIATAIVEWLQLVAGRRPLRRLDLVGTKWQAWLLQMWGGAAGESKILWIKVLTFPDVDIDDYNGWNDDC